MKEDKLIVIAPEGCYSFLTTGKEYIAKQISISVFLIQDDEGDSLVCLFKDCAYLNGGNWIIKK